MIILIKLINELNNNNNNRVPRGSRSLGVGSPQCELSQMVKTLWEKNHSEECREFFCIVFCFVGVDSE